MKSTMIDRECLLNAFTEILERPKYIEIRAENFRSIGNAIRCCVVASSRHLIVSLFRYFGISSRKKRIDLFS